MTACYLVRIRIKSVNHRARVQVSSPVPETLHNILHHWTCCLLYVGGRAKDDLSLVGVDLEAEGAHSARRYSRKESVTIDTWRRMRVADLGLVRRCADTVQDTILELPDRDWMSRVRDNERRHSDLKPFPVVDRVYVEQRSIQRYKLWICWTQSSWKINASCMGLQQTGWRKRLAARKEQV